MQFPEAFTPQYGITYAQELKPGKNPVWFRSEGFKLAGNVFTPPTYQKDKVYPTIVTVTPAGAVKEQAAGLYAKQLAELGYITLAFDHRTFGESEGWPRYREDPFMKVYDIKHAVTFMTCLDQVSENNLALLGICSGAGYAAYAAAFDCRVQGVATVSGIFDFPGWVTQAGALPFEEMLQTSAKARRKFYTTGEADYVDAWYGETKFAATPQDWETRDQFWSQASQYYREGGNRDWYKVTNGDYRDAQCVDNRYMMNANPVLKYLGDRKLLAIRGQDALTGGLSDEAISFTNKGHGELFVIPGKSHIDLYHQTEEAMKKLGQFYRKVISAPLK